MVVHVKAPSDALRKRQFTMHIFCNAGEGGERDGYTELMCKGKQKGRRTAIEKNAWNKKIPVLFQKNAWVDADIAKELAADFVQHERKKHGDLWVVVSLDNLSVHVADDVKKTFADGNVFLLFFLHRLQNLCSRLMPVMVDLSDVTLEIYWINGL